MRDHYTRYPRTILWLVPGGRLALGPHPGRRGLEGDVEIQPFYISKFPITNEQFEAFDPGFERSVLSPRDRDPALGVGWDEASEYSRWYAEVSRKPMRLPSEEEWEYACRGGSAGRFYWGSDAAEADRFVWHRENSGEKVPLLDAKKANDFGLFGMLGGVWEWVGARGNQNDETVPALRGGSFRTPLGEISCSLRLAVGSAGAPEGAAFRIVKSLR